MNIKIFLRNIKYLFTRSIFDREQALSYEIYNKIEDTNKYKEGSGKSELKVLDYNSTVDLLLKEPKSFCRFGDGDIAVMNGINECFQNADSALGGGND